MKRESNSNTIPHSFTFASVFASKVLPNMTFSTENCVDVHMKKDPGRVALIWEKDEPGDVEHVTYM